MFNYWWDWRWMLPQFPSFKDVARYYCSHKAVVRRIKNKRKKARR